MNTFSIFLLILSISTFAEAEQMSIEVFLDRYTEAIDDQDVINATRLIDNNGVIANIAANKLFEKAHRILGSIPAPDTASLDSTHTMMVVSLNIYEQMGNIPFVADLHTNMAKLRLMSGDNHWAFFHANEAYRNYGALVIALPDDERFNRGKKAAMEWQMLVRNNFPSDESWTSFLSEHLEFAHTYGKDEEALYVRQLIKN